MMDILSLLLWLIYFQARLSWLKYDQACRLSLSVWLFILRNCLIGSHNNNQTFQDGGIGEGVIRDRLIGEEENGEKERLEREGLEGLFLT